MMTIVEKWLKDYIAYCTNKNYVLYKFYEEHEDRSDGLPDVWDTLLDMYDNAEEQYDKERVAFATEIASGRHPSHLKVDLAKKQYEEIKKMLDYVENSKSRYFIIKAKEYKIQEVVKRKFPIYQAVLDGEYMKLEETIDYTYIWTFGINMCPMTYTALSDYYITVDPYYLEFGGKYVFYLQDINNFEELKLHYYTCKNCGKIFSLTNSHIRYFKEHDLYIPKRCDYCRADRKALKAYIEYEENEKYPFK